VGFFPDQWDTLTVVVGAAVSLGILGVGLWVFPRLERPVLKEL
jgi:ABC-2 type transport system permease protein